MRNHVIVLVALLLPSTLVGAADQELMQAILSELKSKPISCPADLPQTLLCGDFHAGFSTFKFELEFELGLQDFQAEPLTPWKLLGGVYARTYRLGEEVLSIGFDRKRRIVILKQGALPKEPEEPRPVEEGSDEPEAEPDPDGERGGYRQAGGSP